MSSEKRQAKALSDLGRVLAPEVRARAYAAGRANARMTPQATYLVVGVLLLILVVAVATGRILIPGFLVLALFVSAIKPMRGIAVVDHGIVVVSTSAVNGKPKAVLGELPQAVLLPPHIHWVGTKAVRVPLGPDMVRLRARDYERLTGALGVAPSEPAPVAVGSSPAPAEAGWYPMDGDRYRQGYWNGAAWTAVKHWNGDAWVDPESSLH
jgi:hypothetical protein